MKVVQGNGPVAPEPPAPESVSIAGIENLNNFILKASLDAVSAIGSQGQGVPPGLLIGLAQAAALARIAKYLQAIGKIPNEDAASNIVVIRSGWPT